MKKVCILLHTFKQYIFRQLVDIKKQLRSFLDNKKNIVSYNKSCQGVNVGGNISIIVLFILTIASFLALFVFQQTQTMLQALGQITRYYQSQALAKAGLELGLVLANTTAIGFEQGGIGSGDTIVQQNFSCAKNNFGCTFSVDIINRTYSFLTNNPFDMQECTSGNVFTLKEGESLIVPLFVDQRKIQIDKKNSQHSSFFSSDHSGYNILLSFPKKQTDEDGIFFYPFRQTTLTDETFAVMLSFATSLESNEDEVVRQKMIQILTGISYVDAKTRNIINDFLYSETGRYYKKEKVGSEYSETWKIPSKITVFGSDENIRNFLILSYPTHCPPNATNSGDLLQIKDRKPKNGDYIPFYTSNQDSIGSTKKWTNCKCPSGLQYNEQKNMCLQKINVDTTAENETDLSYQKDNHKQNQEHYTQKQEYIQENQNIPFYSRQLQFCLYIKGKELSLLGIPTQYVRVSSIGTYGIGTQKTQASFEALQHIDLPDWLFNTVLER